MTSIINYDPPPPNSVSPMFVDSLRDALDQPEHGGNYDLKAAISVIEAAITHADTIEGLSRQDCVRAHLEATALTFKHILDRME